jgi:hypothetical protein
MLVESEAKKAILDIAKKYGVVDEWMVRRMEYGTPEDRRAIEEQLLARDGVDAAAIKT